MAEIRVVGFAGVQAAHDDPGGSKDRNNRRTSEIDYIGLRMDVKALCEGFLRLLGDGELVRWLRRKVMESRVSARYSVWCSLFQSSCALPCT